MTAIRALFHRSRLPALVAVCLAAACAIPCIAAAQPGPEDGPPPDPGAPWMRESMMAESDGSVVLQTSWQSREPNGARRGVVTLQLRDGAGAPRGATLTVYDGPAPMTALAVRAGVVGVALWRGGAAPFVKLVLIDLEAPEVRRALVDRALVGRAAVSVRAGVRVVPLQRRAPARYEPLATVIAPDAVGDGFVVLYQETGPTPDAEAHSTLAVAPRAGRPTVTVVPVPWSLAAIADAGARYVLAVRYDGGSRESTRLCFVTLTRAGQPEQHPWWGAPPDAVDEVQLVRTNAPTEATATWAAVYRGGGGMRHIRAAPVDMGGGWGREAPAPRELGERAQGTPWGVRYVVEGAAVGALRLL